MALVLTRGTPPREQGVLIGAFSTITEPCDVTLLEASGKELEYIRNNFENIPMHDGRVVRWTGEMAKFLAINIKQSFK